MELKIVESSTGFRFFDDETSQQFGELFQKNIRSLEWKAALTVYEEYKRKYNLEFNDLEKLRNYIVDWSKNRESAGKKVNKDVLVQECSAEIKRNYT